jgi:hypothetical protein
MAKKVTYETKKRRQLEAKYAEKGLEISTDWGDKPRIASVKLDLTPEEWIGVLDKEGEYLPMCCGNISRVRDILFDAIRESGDIRCEELYEAVTLLKNHGDCGEIDEGGPLAKLAKVWETIEPDAHCHARGVTKDVDNVKEAICTIANATHILAWEDLFNKDERQKYESGIIWRRHLPRLVPAITTLYNHLKELEYPPVLGYAVYCLFTEEGVEKDEIVDLRSGGYAIYRTPKEAKELADHLNQFNENKEGGRIQVQNYVIREVRVSLEKGIEITQRQVPGYC